MRTMGRGLKMTGVFLIYSRKKRESIRKSIEHYLLYVLVDCSNHCELRGKFENKKQNNYLL